MKMSLDMSRIPKLSKSSRKFIAEKQRKTMNDPVMKRITRTRTEKGETVPGKMGGTRSQKTAEEQKAKLEVEVHPDQTIHENQELHGPEERGNRRLASEFTPVDRGQDFGTSTGTLDREDISELSDIATEIVATRRSPTDKTMMAGVMEKQATSASFSERVKNTFGNIFLFTMGAGTGDEGESQEEEDEYDELVDFGSRVSLNSSTQVNEAYVERETVINDKFGVVRLIIRDTNTPGQSRDFVSMTNSEMQTGQNRNAGLNNSTADPEVDREMTSSQRLKAQMSIITRLPGIDWVTSPLVTPLVESGSSLEEALKNIVCSIGEQNEQMSIRMSEPERAFHVERESLWEEINRNRQEAVRNEKRLKERTDEHLAKNFLRLTREAEQRELRLRDDMEKLRTHQEQTLGTLKTKIDAMMERRTQAIMDRLDWLLVCRSGPREGEQNW